MRKPTRNILLLLVLCGAAVCLVFLLAENITPVFSVREHSPDSSVIEITPDVKHGGYVLNIVMSGQQGSNVKILLAQECFFGALGNIGIVEPFFYHSQFYGEPENKPLDAQLRFRDFFNIRNHNEVANQQHFAQLVSWEDFISNAPREVVYVDLHDSKKPECDIGRFVNCAQKSHCNDNNVQRIQFLQRNKFSVVKTVYTHKSFLKLKNGDTSWPLDKVTLILKNVWPHLFNDYNDTYDNPCFEVFYSNPYVRLIPSKQTLLHAESYESHFLGGLNGLAVVIRLEHILESGARTKEEKEQRYHAIETCLSATANLSVSLGSKSRPFVTTDYSTYTSVSWISTQLMYQYTDEDMNHIFGLGRRVLDDILRGWWGFQEWESSFAEVTGGIDDPGYMAALQRTIAGRAKCLILVGGGDYQNLILQQYMHNLPDASRLCVHLVCVPRFLHEKLQRLLEAFRLQCTWTSSWCTLTKK